MLLTTPLIRSLRRAFPDAAIEALVFEGTEGILAGNPDLNDVIVMPQRPGAGETLALVRTLWRRYDLALSTQAGDRPTLFAFAAGRRRAGFVEPGRLNGRIKRRCSSNPVPIPTVSPRAPRCCASPKPSALRRSPRWSRRRRDRAAGRRNAPYAVVHVAPKFRYKQWTDDGWRALAAALSARGLAVLATGGPETQSAAISTPSGRAAEVERRDGALSWPELTARSATLRSSSGRIPS